eukprot:scaffold5904_cov134-Isochrysis_galbana.AAC.1
MPGAFVRAGMVGTGIAPELTGIDVTGIDVTGIDVTGIDVTGLDGTGIDGTGTDVTAPALASAARACPAALRRWPWQHRPQCPQGGSAGRSAARVAMRIDIHTHANSWTGGTKKKITGATTHAARRRSERPHRRKERTAPMTPHAHAGKHATNASCEGKSRNSTQAAAAATKREAAAAKTSSNRGGAMRHAAHRPATVARREARPPEGISTQTSHAASGCRSVRPWFTVATALGDAASPFPPSPAPPAAQDSARQSRAWAGGRPRSRSERHSHPSSSHPR